MRVRDLVSVFYMWISSFTTPFVDEAAFPPKYVLTFVEDHVAVAMWVYLWVFYAVLLISMSVFMPVICCFNTIPL
jgi:hypothetical protein